MGFCVQFVLLGCISGMFEFRLVLGVCLVVVMVVTYLGTTVTNRSSCIGVVAWTSRASLQRHCRELPWDGRSLR